MKNLKLEFEKDLILYIFSASNKRKEKTMETATFSIEENIKDFKDGKVFSIDFLNNFFIRISNNNEVTYMEVIEFVKKLIPNNYVVTTDLIYLRNKNINKELHVYIVRLLNLTYKGAKIIVINDDVAYIPEKYKYYNQDLLRLSLNKTINSIKLNLLEYYYNKRNKKKKLITRLKNKVYSFINFH